MLLAFVAFQGCQDHPGPDLATGPDQGQAMAGNEAPDLSRKAAGQSGHGSGTVYTLSNGSSANSVIRFAVSAAGSFTPAGSFETGGRGTGSGLGSQGAIVKKGKLLFAVNAGSDEVSVLREKKDGLAQVTTVLSGGTMPISLTVKGDLLYVLNAGGAGNISGFRGASSGKLRPIPGSARPLSGAGVAPAQIQFSPKGGVLVVTEKGTNKIVTYRVESHGRAVGPLVQNSIGDTPYGFDFTPRGQLVVSDAFGGAPLQSALSSYSVDRGGRIRLITGPVADMQTAACWVVISADGKFVYTTNTGTNNISGYRVSHNGSLTLFDDGGNTAPSDPGPIDIALSHNSHMLYVLNAGGNSITSYRRDPHSGTLSQLGTVGGLPAGAAGLIAD
jgi:6-phosphogluconolactonase